MKRSFHRKKGRCQYFTHDLVVIFSKHQRNQNVLISPYGVRNALIMANLATRGKAKEEMRGPLCLKKYGNNPAKYKIFLHRRDFEVSGHVKVTIAQQVFVDASIEVLRDYRNQMKDYFTAEVVPVNFRNKRAAIETINSWASERTQQRVKRIVDLGVLVKTPAAIIVNITDFAGTFKNLFNPEQTKMHYFYLSKSKKVQVSMMCTTAGFRIGKMQNLKCKVIEIPYEDSACSLIILLPNQVEGLKHIEKNIHQLDFLKINDLLEYNTIKLYLPTFEICFELSLRAFLEEMGVHTLFTKKADFSNIVSENTKNFEISEIRHRAQFTVKENGTEGGAPAKAASQYQFEGNFDKFIIDRPFFFYLKDNNHIYLCGHIIDLEGSQWNLADMGVADRNQSHHL